jgi:pentatricopeptide repeat protein
MVGSVCSLHRLGGALRFSTSTSTDKPVPERPAFKEELSHFKSLLRQSQFGDAIEYMKSIAMPLLTSEETHLHGEFVISLFVSTSINFDFLAAIDLLNCALDINYIPNPGLAVLLGHQHKHVFIAPFIGALLQALKSRNIPLDIKTFNAFLYQLQRFGTRADVLEHFRDLEARGLVPDPFTYMVLLMSCVRQKNAKEAISYFEEMKSIGLTPNLAVYGALLHVLSDSVHSATVIYYNEMLSSGIEPNIKIFESMLHYYCRSNDKGNVEDVLNTMRTRGLALSLLCYSDLIRFRARQLDKDGASSLMKEVKEKGYQPRSNWYLYIMSMFQRLKQPNEVRAAYDEMIAVGLKPTNLHSMLLE